MNSLHNNNNSACLCGNHINPSTLKIKHCWVTHGNWSVEYFTRCTLVMHRLVGSIWFFGVTLINLSSFKKTNDLKNWERNLHKPKELDIYMPSHNWEYYLICLPGARFVSRTGLTSLFFGLTLQSSFLFLGEVETRNSLEHPWTVKPKAMVLCVKSRWRWWLTSLNCLLFLFAKMSLGAAGPAVVARNIAHAMDANESLLPQIHRSQKPQQLRGRSKPFSFVMQPDEGKSSSSCMIHGEKSVIDGMASAYIRKFHEKNIYDAHLH